MAFFLHIDCDLTRIKHGGQPANELITIDSYVRFALVSSHPYIETARFPDDLSDIRPRHSARYFHILDQEKNPVICVGQAEKSTRLIVGSYARRRIILPDLASALQAIPGISLETFNYSLVYLGLKNNEGITFRINCIEEFPGMLVLSGVISLPSILDSKEKPETNSDLHMLYHSIAEFQLKEEYSPPIFRIVNTTTESLRISVAISLDGVSFDSYIEGPSLARNPHALKNMIRITPYIASIGLGN